MGVKIKERPNGSGVWWVFINHKGTRKAKKVGKDKKLAQEVAKKIEARLVLGDTGLAEKEKPYVPTLREYVYGWNHPKEGYQIGWLDKVAKLSLKYSTWRGYQHILRHQLIPVFGSRRLNEITPRMIADLLSSKLLDGTRSNTAKNIKCCLSSIFRHARMPDGYISSNPVHGVPVPVPEHEISSRQPDPLTWEDREIIEKAFREHSPLYYPLVFCGFRTGLRIGELIALQWQDIDFRRGLILVQRNMTMGKVTTPKSLAGKRHVRMTAQLIEVFKDHLKVQKERILKYGWGSLPEWVFINQEGNHLNYDNFRTRVWNKVMQKAEIRRRTAHDMRHTYATLRLSKGDSLAEVSKEMGHASTDITYRTYYKWLPQESRTDINELDNLPASICNPAATRK